MANKCFGKHAPKLSYKTPKLRHYLSSNLPAPPPSHNVLYHIDKALNNQYTVDQLFPIDGNDQYGDCTCAAMAHAVTCYQGLIGKYNVMPAAAVTSVYFHLTGGQDTGMNELDVLNYWKANAVGGDEILGYVSIDPSNHTHIQQAITMFGGVYLGFNVQENAESDFEKGITWTPGKLTNDGHAVYAVAYDQNTVTVLTWGSKQKGTWAWWDECVDEAYAILPPESANPSFDPGFNFAKLKADLALIKN